MISCLVVAPCCRASPSGDFVGVANRIDGRDGYPHPLLIQFQGLFRHVVHEESSLPFHVQLYP